MKTENGAISATLTVNLGSRRSKAAENWKKRDIGEKGSMRSEP
jgi:hypothetical protein